MDLDGQQLNQIAHAVADLAVTNNIHTITDTGAYRDAVIRETRATKGDHIRALHTRAQTEGVDLTVDDIAQCIYRNLTLAELQIDKRARARLAALDAEIERNRQRAADDPAPAIMQTEQTGGRLSKHTVNVGLRNIHQIREQLK